MADHKRHTPGNWQATTACWSTTEDSSVVPVDCRLKHIVQASPAGKDVTRLEQTRKKLVPRKLGL